MVLGRRLSQGGPQRLGWGWALQRANAGARGVGFQKELQGPPGNHAAIGLAPRLDLEPIDRAVELRQQSDRYPEVHNGGGRSSRAADFFLRGGRCPGLLSRLGVLGVSGCWHRGDLQRRLSGMLVALRLQRLLL